MPLSGIKSNDDKLSASSMLEYSEKETTNEDKSVSFIAASPAVENTQVEPKANLIGSNSINYIPPSCSGQFSQSHNSLLGVSESPKISKTSVQNCHRQKNICFRSKSCFRRKFSRKSCIGSYETNSTELSSAPIGSGHNGRKEKDSPDPVSKSNDNIVNSLTKESTQPINQNCHRQRYSLITFENSNSPDILCQEDISRRLNGTTPEKLINSRSLSPDTKSLTKFSIKTDLTTLALCKGNNLCIICVRARRSGKLLIKYINKMYF